MRLPILSVLVQLQLVLKIVMSIRHRTIRSRWSAGGSDDDEEEKVKFLMSDPAEKFMLHTNDSKAEVRKARSRNKLIELLGAEYLSLLNELNEEPGAHKGSNNAARKQRLKVKSIDSYSKDQILEEPEDDIFNEDEDEENFRRYRCMGTGKSEEENENDGDRKSYLSIQELLEKSNSCEIGAQQNFKKYHHIGTGNWGEDNWNDICKRKDKRRGSFPCLIMPPR